MNADAATRSTVLRRLGILLALLQVACAGRATPQPATLQPAQEPGVTLALVGGVLIDGTGADPVPNAVVLIAGDRIVAATRNSARACGLDAELGTIEPGKLADVLVVDGDPLTDMESLANTRPVIHDGEVIVDK